MPRFGNTSTKRRDTLHPKLQGILDDAIEIYDFSILCGYRGEAEQTQAYRSGNSTLQFPASKHNRIPARACDVAPYPINWDDLIAFQHLGGIIKGIAHKRGVKIVWGGDWKTLQDMPHFELGRDE